MFPFSDGFYVECGAADGELFSNTLFFERHRNWTGLLIEPNPVLFKRLMDTNRNSFMINACLNTENVTGQYLFDPIPLVGGLVHEMMTSHRQTINSTYDKILVQCFPFYSIIMALGRKRIDLFSLDVEGGELGILKTIPFNEISVDVFLVEYFVKGSKRETVARLNNLRTFLDSKGYGLVAILKRDLLFIKRNVMSRLSLKYWRAKLEN